MSNEQDYGELLKELTKFKVMGLVPTEAILKLKEKFQGTRTLTHRAVGRIVHPGGAPIPGLEVELWDRDLIGDDFLGRGMTDADGRFDVGYNPSDAGLGDRPDLEVRLYDPPQEGTVDGEPRIRRQIVDVVKGEDDVTEAVYDFKTVEVAYYEYTRAGGVDFPFSERDSIRRPFVPGAMATFSNSLSKFAPIDIKFNMRLAKNEEISHVEIQGAYPESLTQRMEKENRGSTRTDEYFVHRLLNGFYPAKAFRVDPENPARHTIAYNFDEFELNGYLDLPNFSIDLDLGDDKLKLAAITLQFRKPGDENLVAGGAMQDPVRYTPADGEKWEQAKRVARAFYFGIVGQLQGHVAETHFNMEQYALSMSRHLKNNPVRDLLMPHLKEVININDQGRDLLLGAETGIFPRAKPIKMASQLRWLTNNVGRHDWAGFRPRRSLCSGHEFANVANHYWDGVLTPFVDKFFADHDAEIRSNWAEIKLFSDELMNRSVPHMTDHMEDVDDDRPFYDMSEFQASKDREEVTFDGVTAIRSLSRVASDDKATDEDIEKLKQVCRYCIYYTTLVHGWFHQEQNNEFGELKYSAMLRNGSMGAEDDTNIMLPPDLLSLALRTTNTLQGFTWGFLLKNEDGDVLPDLVARVDADRAKFSEMNFDVNNLRSRMNA
jgi:hypothetical protein